MYNIASSGGKIYLGQFMVTFPIRQLKKERYWSGDNKTEHLLIRHNVDLQLQNTQGLSYVAKPWMITY